jgi:ethanolamine utilization protein EutJ
MIIESELLTEFDRLIREKDVNPYEGELKCGVDLGTANIVVAVVDENDYPIAGASHPSKVVKDGIVVDYIGAIRVLKQLKAELEERIGCELYKASCAIPPGILDGNTRCIANVVEGAGFEVINIVDEPTAAARVLGIENGGVVDIGGGTTGISIIEDGEVTYVADEPTGGTHMTLVLSGYYSVPYDAAEEMKKDLSRQDIVFPIIKPVASKMASIVRKFIERKNVSEIYLVGGACSFDEFEQVFEKETGLTCYKANVPLLVTPLGIAMYCEDALGEKKLA